MSAQRAALRTTSVLVSIALSVLALGTVPAAHAARPESAADAVTSPEDHDKGGAGQPTFAKQPTESGAPALTASPAVTRSEALARAESWVPLGLKYSWTTYHDGYRQDCSGYVSMAWKLSTAGGGLTTDRFLPSGVASRISKSDLKAGDALLNPATGAQGHVALFDHWTDASQTSYVAYEFTGSGVHHRTIPYPYFSGHGEFFPVRNNSIVDDVVPPKPPKLRLDFDGDGRADVAGKLSDGNLLLWKGLGNGTLDTQSGYGMWPDNG
ncbi:VCBS repeat-containing protein, partial [Kitasatospora sp. A2-31]